MKNESTGEIEREGCSIHYIMAENLNPVDNDGVLGYAPIKESVGVAYYDIFKKLGVPCVLEAEMGMKTKNGSPVLFIQGFNLDEKKK